MNNRKGYAIIDENGKYVISLTYYAWTDENTFNGNLNYWIEVYC